MYQNIYLLITMKGVDLVLCSSSVLLNAIIRITLVTSESLSIDSGIESLIL